jgi:hypothetical protein
MRQLRLLRSMITDKNEEFVRELELVHAALIEAGIEVLHYKGAVAAQYLYDDFHMRQFGDIDLLFPKTRSKELLAVFARLGYKTSPGMPGEHDYLNRFEKDFLLTRGPFILEPHWSLTARRISINVDYNSLWARSVPMNLQSSTLRTFGPEDMLCVLSICGSKGQWQRLQMITDVAQMLRGHSDLDWGKCMLRAEQSGCARMVRLGLFCAIEWFDAPVPEEVRAWVVSDKQLPKLVSSICEVLLLDDPKSAWGGLSPASFNRLIMGLHDGAKNKAIYLIRSTTSPSVVHLRRFPLPSFLRFLYRIIVPVYDYVGVPIVRRTRSLLSE